MAGYSPNPLSKKLGYKEGFVIRLIHAPENYDALTDGVANQLKVAGAKAKDIDLIHFFTNSLDELQTQLPLLTQQIKKNGTIWISWYKKSAKKPTELNENLIRDIALSIGLVDVKVCAVDDDWSGLKLVYRLVDRR